MSISSEYRVILPLGIRSYGALGNNEGRSEGTFLRLRLRREIGAQQKLFPSSAASETRWSSGAESPSLSRFHRHSETGPWLISSSASSGSPTVNMCVRVFFYFLFPSVPFLRLFVSLLLCMLPATTLSHAFYSPLSLALAVLFRFLYRSVLIHSPTHTHTRDRLSSD